MFHFWGPFTTWQPGDEPGDTTRFRWRLFRCRRQTGTTCLSSATYSSSISKPKTPMIPLPPTTRRFHCRSNEMNQPINGRRNRGPTVDGRVGATWSSADFAGRKSSNQAKSVSSQLARPIYVRLANGAELPIPKPNRTNNLLSTFIAAVHAALGGGRVYGAEPANADDGTDSQLPVISLRWTFLLLRFFLRSQFQCFLFRRLQLIGQSDDTRAQTMAKLT